LDERRECDLLDLAVELLLRFELEALRLLE
jgi:hypothetical protein